jgi:hypothetical protein
MLSDARRHAEVSVVELAGLDLRDVGEMLDRHRVAVAALLAAHLHAATGGNPLLIVELLRGAQTSDGLDPNALSRMLDHHDVPRAAADLVAQRCAALADSGEILSWAALVGTEFELEVIEQASGRRDGLERLEEAASAGLVREIADGRWQFRHALTRDALVARQAVSRATRRHDVLADAIEQLIPAHAAVGRVARHRCAAARPGRGAPGARAALAAAQTRIAQLAPAEALLHVDGGLRSLGFEAHPDRELEAALHLAAADAYHQEFEEDRWITAANAATRAARQAGSATLLARSALARAAFWTQGELEVEVIGLLDDALQMLGDEDPTLRSRLLSTLAGVVAVSSARPPSLAGRSAVSIAEEAVRLAGPEADDAWLTAMSSLIVALWAEPQASRQVALADELARDEQPASALLAARWGAAPRLALGDRPGFERDVDLLCREAARIGWRQLNAYGRQCACLLALLDGRFDEGAVLGAEAVDVGRGHPNFLRVYQAQLFWIAAERDDLAALLEPARAIVAENRDLPVFHAMLGLILADLGEHDEAEAILDSLAVDDFAKVTRDVLWLATIAACAEMAATVRSARHAATLRDLLEPYGGQLVVVAGGAFVYGAADRFRAKLAVLDGNESSAEQLFESAIEVECAIGSAALEARTRVWRRRLLGDPTGRDLDRVTALHAALPLPWAIRAAKPTA